ncbi:hypothetical protein HZB60_00750 [candidate division KSB1 bacterium]|nr:hypothetical protein [candidate division KSB1 bacterium]
MKPGLFAALTLCLTLTAFAQPSKPSAINFNLVQVNNYAGQEQVVHQVATPGQRVIIDPNNPNAAGAFAHFAAPKATTAQLAPFYRVSVSGETCSLALPWESSAVVVSPSGQDSFLVRTSRTGCPGTEVRPSVSVAFATGRGWSDPPIRFGPLSESTICALGRGQQLEVCVKGDAPPKVRVLSSR